MESKKAFDQLKEQVDAWVQSLVPPGYENRIRKPTKDDVKIIRDAVTGYQHLEPHEYLVLDHPLVQRLRYIHQTGLAYLVYPTANHTRFDHSLGCAKVAKDVGNHLIPDRPKEIKELALAALLHDVGHAFFSHLSENIMEANFREEYLALKEAPEFQGLSLHLSEMMSYLIVTSTSFGRFLDKVVHHYYDLDLGNVAKIIIHRPSERLAFMGDIISGPFDVDKLDYLVRDCYFTGIRADVDVDRVVISTCLLDPNRYPEIEPRWKKRFLVMRATGVSVLEQITFNKMLLYPSVYHHHKIRGIECMVKAVFACIWDDENADRIKDPRLKFQSILDFYKLTEPEFMTLTRDEPVLKPLIEKILHRDLLERCLVLFAPYLTTGRDGWKHLSKRHYEDSPKEMRRLSQRVWDELPQSTKGKVAATDIWVDIPKTPPLGDPDKGFIDIGTNELVPLSEFFPYSHWLSTYGTNKLKGHVFGPNDSTIRIAINEAAKTAFKKHYLLDFDERATIDCKLC